MRNRLDMKKMPFFHKGATMWEIGMLLFALGFVAMCVLTVVPKYIEDATVATALKGVHEEFYGKDPTNTAVKGRLQKTFQVNTVSPEVEKALKITREGGGILVTLNYEVRENLIGNIDVVMSFNHEVDLSKPLVSE